MKTPWLCLLPLAALACPKPSTEATPSGAPFRDRPAAVKSLVNASVHVTLRAVVRAIADEGLSLRLVDEERGIVESEYFDVATVEPLADRYPPAEREVRYTFSVQPDTLGRGSRVALFALYQPYRLGGPQGRGNERTVPRDHPAVSFAKKLMERVERTAIGGTD